MISITATHTKMLARLGLLIALEIILTRFCSIQTPTLRIGFGFLPIAIAAILYGPLAAGAAYAIGDLIGAFLFPVGMFFPGFTLTAFLTGMAYGLLLYKQRRSWWRLACAVGIVTLLLNLGLDTVWLMIILGKGFLVLLPERLIKSVVMIPVQMILIGLLWEKVKVWLKAPTL